MIFSVMFSMMFSKALPKCVSTGTWETLCLRIVEADRDRVGSDWAVKGSENARNDSVRRWPGGEAHKESQ